jgi:hypothetical protein
MTPLQYQQIPVKEFPSNKCKFHFPRPRETEPSAHGACAFFRPSLPFPSLAHSLLSEFFNSAGVRLRNRLPFGCVLGERCFRGWFRRHLKNLRHFLKQISQQNGGMLSPIAMETETRAPLYFKEQSKMPRCDR